MWKIVLSILTLLLSVAAAVIAGQLSRKSEPEPERVAGARKNCEQKLRTRCGELGISYPPRELYVRAFKLQQVLEVWGSGGKGPLQLLATYAFTANSGGPGPKRREGDGQIPEGLYLVERMNPQSSYHLSLGINYPNASDLVRSDKKRPGFDIFIHGGDQSVGCIALGDAAIEEVYLLAHDTWKEHAAAVRVDIFPARFDDSPEWLALQTAEPGHEEFWKELRPAYDAFETSRETPRFRVDANGRYIHLKR